MARPRERMLRLLSLLQSGRAWPADDLAAALDVPNRTLRRDIDQLRELGYPVRSARGPGGHYRLVAGAALPPLMLDDDEAVATVLGLRLAAAGGTGVEHAAESAERAAAKLRRILPAALRRRTDEVLAAVEIGRSQHPQVDPTHLSVAAAAIAADRCLTFRYRSAQGMTDRTVEPVRLVQLRHRWYLYAWDRERHDWRNFRLDRITDLQRIGVAFRPRPLPAEDLAAYVEEQFHGPQTLRVVLTLSASARDSAARLHRIDGTLESLDERSCRYVAYVDSFEWLATVLTLTDIEFRVEEPDEFRDYLADTARRLLRASMVDECHQVRATPRRSFG